MASPGLELAAEPQAVFVCIAERVWVSEAQGRWEGVKEGKQNRICFKSKPFDAEIA